VLTTTTFLTSFAATAFMLPLIRRLAVKVGAVDYPGGRKIHDKITPLLGGVGIYIGLLAGICFDFSQFKAFQPLLIGATGIFCLGLVEDIRGLTALTRFLLQMAIAFLMTRMGLSVTFLPVGWWGALGDTLISMIWIVGVTNAYNFLDGLDGLAAGSAAINLFFFSLMLYSTGQFPAGLISVSLIASCLAFLPFNFSSHKIFLGEAGSTLLGFSLACISLMGAWATDAKAKLLIPVLILGVPIFDMIFTTIMRVREGKVRTIIEWLRYGGKDHFHHYLVDLGLSQHKAVAFIYSVTFFLGISAILLQHSRGRVDAFLSLVQAAIIFCGIAALIVVGKHRRSGWEK
jgi:UDP-GlcNAc:undecaprenyl-phosphate/decaprenyl-phosphate GlcNAc-1-phosphate transferase